MCFVKYWTYCNLQNNWLINYSEAEVSLQRNDHTAAMATQNHHTALQTTKKKRKKRDQSNKQHQPALLGPQKWELKLSKEVLFRLAKHFCVSGDLGKCVEKRQSTWHNWTIT